MNRRAFLAQVLRATATGTATAAVMGSGQAFAATSASAVCDDLAESLKPILEESRLPALAAGAVKQGRLLALGAVGLRMVGAEDKVTPKDKFHIGSCTKAMTATLAGIFVERKKLSWTSTIPDIFPERRDKVDAGYRQVTLEMLLSHRGGLPHDGGYYGKLGAPVREQRLAYMDEVLAQAPPNTVDTFNYSNAGYIIAGAMLERVTGKTWEDLMREELFKPLQMSSGGFGVAMTGRRVDQPWPHVKQDGKFVPRYGDNHRALGPAGTVHCSLEDYLKFATLHASMGTRPRGMLSQASFKKLHQPAKDNYAMGWGVLDRDWAKGKALSHAGSNNMNYFVVWLAPATQFALAVGTNASDEKTPAALDRVAGLLVQKYSQA